MDETAAIDAFSALAQETRLGIFRMLVRAAPDGVAAGEIARATGTRQNTLSSHLAILARAGLVQGERNGRTIMYRADLGGASALIGFLLEDCCNGRSEVCQPVAATLNCLASTDREPWCD